MFFILHYVFKFIGLFKKQLSFIYFFSFYRLEKSRKSAKRKNSLSRKPSTSSIKENGDELVQLNCKFLCVKYVLT